jgi:acid phosphatase (class A)
MMALAAAAGALLTLGAAPASRPSGYLGEAAPDTYAIVPPSPAPGDPRDAADRAIYRATRGLEASPRWAQAQNDDSSAGILKDLSCAVGVELTPQAAPKTYALMLRLAPDVTRATNRPKDVYKRRRPYLRDPGPICIARSAGLAASPDYPSGHNTWAWTVGLIMAELVPDRATPILVRARAFGENRLICGVHSLSAVEAGRLNGSIVVAALHGDPQFRADLEEARLELAAARAAGPAPDPGFCAAEAAMDAKTPY